MPRACRKIGHCRKRRRLDAAGKLSHPAAMEPKPRQPPVLSEHGKREAARRQAREAAALRDNLKKRKQQTRRREDKETAPETGDA
jgi:hypothetical protein